jgi:hypothetical protein
MDIPAEWVAKVSETLKSVADSNLENATANQATLDTLKGVIQAQSLLFTTALFIMADENPETLARFSNHAAFMLSQSVERATISPEAKSILQPVIDALKAGDAAMSEPFLRVIQGGLVTHLAPLEHPGEPLHE